MEDNLKEYFGGIWKPDWAKFEHSGYKLIEKINDLQPESVLDIGCGYNQLKEQIPNLYGVIGIILIIVGVILLNTLGKAA